MIYESAVLGLQQVELPVRIAGIQMHAASPGIRIVASGEQNGQN
jgi:orotidine-5'-phosphate decarboxylase